MQDAWGFATDPIGLDRSSKTLSDSIQRTLIQLQALEGVVNYDVQQRLEQIRSIIRDAINGTQAIIDDATSKMLTLEAQINSDAINLLYQVECLTNTVLNDQLQQAFSNFISNLKKADPSITIFGYHLVGVSLDQVKIDDFNVAYVSTKSIVLTALNKQINDQSSAYRILFAYQSLEKAAMSARCAYARQPSSAIWFTQEVNDWERLSRPWVSVVRPKAEQ